MRATQATIQDYLRSQGIPFRRDVGLNTCCTWRIGGPADFLVEPSCWEQVAVVLQYTRENGVPAIVIGKGSNLLFDDAGLRGVVIKIGRKLSRFSVVGTTIQAESGISASRLARAAGQAGLSGLEHIIGIPGTLGGLVFMNGGSQRKCIGDAIVEVKTMDQQGDIRVSRRDECEFAYRRSRFQDEHCIIMDATMKLVPGLQERIMADMLQLLRERRKKFPLTLPNCGSVFKSDPQSYGAFGPPGKIIESIGLKGMSVGDAAVSERHANFIVNRANAKAQDVLSLIDLIRQQVVRQVGLALECEVQFVGATGVVRAL